ncbi:Ig-like domain-containing protein [Halomonas kalidii]|uniref:DNRLRE domain-containing protein n=1 Tax=Halomonas kalidii TaxID=3043293 RepID=A0ABT6VL44_9GAMM|nr:DNRLRE domain-containing protein [Halomonas kalidii]MDI5934704.1 DNRLRE domain-containing protein [Halomonas kalidii]
MAFQHGSGGYLGGVDTHLHEAQPRANRSSATTLAVDSEARRGEVQALLRFDDIFGGGAGQIPPGAIILSATLELQTTTSGDGARLHRMLQPWSDNATWDSLESGIQADGTEAMRESDLETGFLEVGTSRLDVTSSLQAWADGQANHGWALLPLGPDGWSFDSAEGAVPPRLIVEYSLPGDGEPTGDAATPLATEGMAAPVEEPTDDSDPAGEPDGDETLTTLHEAPDGQTSNTSGTDDSQATMADDDVALLDDNVFTFSTQDDGLTSESTSLSMTTSTTSEPVIATSQFQQGSNGYAGVVDTFLYEGQPRANRGSQKTLTVDSEDRRGEVQALVRFDDIFGSGAGQIPLGATILSATLELQTTTSGDGARLHRMLQSWSDSATWDSLGNGIQADGVEAMVQSDLNTGFVAAGTTQLDVTTSLQAWANGQANHGWAFLPLGPDGWSFDSAEGSVPPKLIIEYSFEGGEPVNTPPVANDDSASTLEGTAVQIAVLANDSDPDGDPLTVGSITQPPNGSVTVNANGTITYTPNQGFVGSDSFTYRASDGQLLSDPATVTVTVDPGEEPPPTSTTVQFQHGSGGYAGGVDTYLHGAQPGTSRATATTLNVDSADNGGAVQTLLRFDALFGSATGQIPLGATILSATLELQTTGKGDGARLHRMLQPWNDSATWDSLENGIQADGIEAMLESDLNTGFVAIGTTRLDVTASLQAWASGQVNHGWAFLPTGSDGWDFLSAEGSSPPRLIVEYTTEGGGPTNNPPIANHDSATTEQGAAVQIAVLANDSDPDGDPLTVGSATQPANGTITINANGTITYTPNHGFHGSDGFTYRAYDGQLLSDPATVSLTVTQSDDPPPPPLDTSYIATAFNTSDTRNFEHTNATKSFYHAGAWWGVLPEQSGWHVYRFDGTLPDPGTMGGWVKSSPTMLTSGRRADIAWDDATDTLYVLNFGPSETQPRLFELAYNQQTQAFEIDANIQLAGSGGKLTGAEWQRNTEMALGLDQNGNPVVSLIGPSAAGGEKGLKLAYPTSSDLGTWATSTIDSGPSTTSGSNGDNKVDFVAFQLNGVDHVGLVYGDNATGLWKFAYQPTPSSPAGYGSGWTIETITGEVKLDNHLAALWDGNAIIMTMKDDKDALWAIKGLPGNWQDPVLVHAATHSASRPTLAYDEDNEMVFIFYQENTSRPYGDIHYKVSYSAELLFDASDPGTRFITSTRPDENMSDPQMPTHSVGSATDSMFFVFARNQEAREIWYNDFLLSDDLFIA